MLRDIAGPPEQTDADVNRMFTRATALRECPVSAERMVKVNQLSLAYFRRHLPSSWAQRYLADRFGGDITNDVRFQPGHAPAGWTNLVDHLRRHGVNEEMTITGVATMASTGRPIDRFRDRVVFPIIHHGQILGFVSRRHPNLNDADRAGPKYLNQGAQESDQRGGHAGAARPIAGVGGPVCVDRRALTEMLVDKIIIERHPSKIDKDGKRHYLIRAIPYQDPQQEAERLKSVHEARVKIVPRV
jgi:hypothetical protein